MACALRPSFLRDVSDVRAAEGLAVAVERDDARVPDTLSQPEERLEAILGNRRRRAEASPRRTGEKSPARDLGRAVPARVRPGDAVDAAHRKPGRLARPADPGE